MANDRNASSRSAQKLTSVADHPPLRSFAMSLPMSLLRARESVMRHFRANLRSFGLTEQQWRVLRALSSKDGIEVAELVELTFLLGPSLSRILKELEGRKVIVRTTPDSDQRRGIISLTAKGRQLIDEVGVYSETVYAEISERFGSKKLAALQATLKELEDALAKPIDVVVTGKQASRRSRRNT